jgi:hypothetical protein
MGTNFKVRKPATEWCKHLPEPIGYFAAMWVRGRELQFSFVISALIERDGNRRWWYGVANRVMGISRKEDGTRHGWDYAGLLMKISEIDAPPEKKWETVLWLRANKDIEYGDLLKFYESQAPTDWKPLGIRCYYRRDDFSPRPEMGIDPANRNKQPGTK